MSEIPSGAMRFNSDSQKLEYWNGSAWFQVHTATPNLASAGDRQPGARGLFGGGYAPGSVNTIDYINISSTGNAQDFGDLITAQSFNSSCSSSTRGLFSGSFPLSNTIEYVTISSTGNAQDFGDLTTPVESNTGTSNSTRGIFAGGIYNGPLGLQSYNTIDFITISSTGNAQDFGDLVDRYRQVGACASSTRGVFAGGRFQSPTTFDVNVIQYITIATTGNAQDFGDLNKNVMQQGGCSNSTRGLFGGGFISPTYTNDIDYIIISTLGNSQNFGDLSVSRSPSSCSSSTRGIWAGGVSIGNTNTIDYVTILTQGNAVDFGDLTQARHGLSACSNAHGGL